MTDQTKGKETQGVKSSAGRVARTDIDSKLLPVFADLQRRMVATVKGEAIRELQEVHEALAPNGVDAPTETDREEARGEQRQSAGEPQPPSGLTLTVSRHHLEEGCRTVLSVVVDALFSDAQRTAVKAQSDEMLRSTSAAARKARPDAAALKETRQKATRILDDMSTSLFSDELRNQTLQDGEHVIQALVRGDLPTARREGEQALLSLTERRGAILASHWEHVFRSLVSLPSASSTEKNAAEAKPSSSSDSADAQDNGMPQTIARSDKQAQGIWSRAYTRAAKQHGEGRKAERVAYDALKETYEKKGDRWVKKSRESEA
jgi:hypothetical protein